MAETIGAALKPEIVARREGRLGHITLNRPAAFNALTLDMVRALDAALGWIDRCYAGDTVEEILDALEGATEPEARAAAAEIAGNAPTALKVTLQALRDARHLGLDDCLDREFRISRSITRRPDFAEGVRAAVVDKDRDPRWHPSRLADVGRREVLRHLAPVDGEELGLGAA